ncbi:MAG: glutathione-disulfide reductase [Xanthomonadales bacterium]|nr:glutathione-disulfide reductase [Xanthomonadales bacterium]
MAHDCDLAVIGGGSGGLALAQRAAAHGARVVLYEPGRLGGTCVHLGCVPKKAMWLAAQSADQVRLAAQLGFAVDAGELDWPAFVARRQAYVGRAETGYAGRLAELGIERFAEPARLLPARKVCSAAGIRSAAHIAIATGSRPRRLPVPGFDLGGVSDDVFALDRLPRRVVVVGGGYVAVEMASLLAALGSEVEMLVRGSRLLDGFDEGIGETLVAAMRRRGIAVSTRVEVTGVEQAADGTRTVSCAGGHRRDGIDWLLWAVGRVPNSEDLGLADIGLATTDSGHIAVDAWQRTGIDGIYALGDVGTQPALTPVAVAAGRRLADRLFGGQPDACFDPAQVPTVVFALPPVASCGLSEAQARERHGDTAVAVHTKRFLPMREALAGRDEPVWIKLVCVGEEERIVGLHLVGPGVDEILQGFAVAMGLGATRADFQATVAIHPGSAEEVVLI